MINYPPLLEPVIPGFAYAVGILEVPFQHNPYVDSYAGLQMRILSVNSSTEILNSRAMGTFSEKVSFMSDKSALTPGEYYKIQLAYIDANGVVGAYSSAAIIKYVGNPQINIQLNTNALPTQYIINIINIYDTVTHYKYQVSHSGTTVEESDWIFAKDKNSLIITPKTDLYVGSGGHILLYSVKTQSNYIYTGMTASLPNLGDLNITNLKFSATSNFKFGCINISIFGETTDLVGDQYGVLYRRAKDSQLWEIVSRDLFFNSSTGSFNLSYQDFFVEQGIEYTYSYQFQGYKRINLTNSISSASIVYASTDFESMFLQDEDHILQLRFNPSISSFKTTILQNKVETIGSQYPFIFKNGDVAYKEFPLSGLISYHADENNLFLKDEDIGLSAAADLRESTGSGNRSATRTRTTSLEGYNYTAERKFKLTVLNWLNNGKPKLFRSPTEGNYIVNLMNVSLTPYESLGGLVHTFSCTCYEVDETTYDNLQKHHLIYNK